MKKAKRREPWLIPLREYLGSNFDDKFKKWPARVKRRSLYEVLEGARFCLENGMSTDVALEETFDMSNPCRCILAKNSSASYFFDALEEYKLSFMTACKSGFAMSAEISNLLRDGEYQHINYSVYGDLWKRIYNHLWLHVGRFFKSHAEFLADYAKTSPPNACA